MANSGLRRGGLVLLAVLILALGALACVGGGADPTAVPPTPVPPTAVPPTAAPVESGLGSVDIVNNSSSKTICYVYISSTTSDSWGDDQLGSDNTVAPGQTFTITDVPVGTYDLRADDCDNTEIDSEMGVEITAEGITWTFTDN